MRFRLRQPGCGQAEPRPATMPSPVCPGHYRSLSLAFTVAVLKHTRGWSWQLLVSVHVSRGSVHLVKAGGDLSRRQTNKCTSGARGWVYPFIGREEATVIDGRWRRTALASRLFGEPAVQAPAPLLLNWSPQNLGTHKLHHHVRIILSEPGESARTHRSASISSLYLCSFLLVFFLLPNSSSPSDRHRPRLSLSKPYKAR